MLRYAKVLEAEGLKLIFPPALPLIRVNIISS